MSDTVQINGLYYRDKQGFIQGVVIERNLNTSADGASRMGGVIN